jgi:hypothetical protein
MKIISLAIRPLIYPSKNIIATGQVLVEHSDMLMCQVKNIDGEILVVFSKAVELPKEDIEDIESAIIAEVRKAFNNRI